MPVKINDLIYSAAPSAQLFESNHKKSMACKPGISIHTALSCVIPSKARDHLTTLPPYHFFPIFAPPKTYSNANRQTARQNPETDQALLYL